MTEENTTLPSAEALSATTATAKKAGKGGKTAAKKADLDLLQSIISDVENATEETALASVSAMLEAVDSEYFRLGGLLTRIHEENWWKVKEYQSFRQFIEQEHGMAYRKSMYLIQIYKDISKSGIKWEQVAKIGWTKLKEISPLLTPDNIDEWVERATNMTVLQLLTYLQALKNPGKGEGGGKSSTTSDVTTKTFKLHSDQKEIVEAALEKAKHDAGTEHDNVALQSICEQFLADAPTGKKAPKVGGLDAESFKSLGYEKVLEIFAAAFPEIDLEVSLPK